MVNSYLHIEIQTKFFLIKILNPFISEDPHGSNLPSFQGQIIKKQSIEFLISNKLAQSIYYPKIQLVNGCFYAKNKVKILKSFETFYGLPKFHKIPIFINLLLNKNNIKDLKRLHKSLKVGTKLNNNTPELSLIIHFDWPINLSSKMSSFQKNP